MGAEELGCGALHGFEGERPGAVPGVGSEEGWADTRKHTPGAKARFYLWPMRPKAKALGYPILGGAKALGYRSCSIKDAVLVGFAEGGVAGVEGFGGVVGGEDADAGGEGPVECAEEVFGGDVGVEREGGDLGEGVDPGVGAARALREDGLSGEMVDCGGECALDGGVVGLHLPAVVEGAVVAEGELEVHRDSG